MADAFDRWGLPENATDHQIRSAYRRRVQKMHPDRVGASPQSQAAFCQLQDDYDVLKDPNRRAALIASRRQPPPKQPPSRPMFQSASMPAPSRATAYVPPSVLHVRLAIPLRQAWLGGQGRVRVMLAEPCPGAFSITHAGCPLCHGARQIMVPRALTISWPAGQIPGHPHIIQGLGHPGTHERGDLVIHIDWAKTDGWRWSPGQGVLKTGWVPHTIWKAGGPWWFRSPSGSWCFVTLSPRITQTSVLLRLTNVGLSQVAPREPALLLKPAPWGANLVSSWTQYVRKTRHNLSKLWSAAVEK